MAFEGKLIPKRDEILETFSEKFRTQALLGMSNLRIETDKGIIRKAVMNILKIWDFDSSNFHLSLEDKL